MPLVPAWAEEQTESPVHGQFRVAPQPSGRVPPHFPAKPVAQAVGAQHVLSAAQTPLFGHAFVIVAPHPSSNWPQAAAAASAGSAGVQGFPHLPFALHTSPGAHFPQSTVAPPQALLIVPHSRASAAHSRAGSGGPHRFAMPSVAQDSPGEQLPQPARAPHPSEMNPHSAFWARHSVFGSSGTQLPPTDFGVGSHRLNPALQVKPAPHPPQSVSVVRGPQPSQAGPHSNPRSSHVGLLQATQRFVFGSHWELAAQSPQSSRTPHVFRIFPHSAPRSLQVVKGSIHLCASVSQASPAAHPPQFSCAPLQGSMTGPHSPAHASGFG